LLLQKIQKYGEIFKVGYRMLEGLFMIFTFSGNTFFGLYHNFCQKIIDYKTSLYCSPAQCLQHIHHIRKHKNKQTMQNKNEFLFLHFCCFKVFIFSCNFLLFDDRRSFIHSAPASCIPANSSIKPMISFC